MHEELIKILVMARYEAKLKCDSMNDCRECPGRGGNGCWAFFEAEYLIDKGVTLHEHGCWETVVDVKDNTACGNSAKIEYKRCSCCKNPAKFLEDDFCGRCGAKLDLPQPPKGE